VVEVREAAVRRHDGRVVLVEDLTGAGGGATVSGPVYDTVSGTVDDGTVDDGTVDNGTVLLEVMHAVHTAPRSTPWRAATGYVLRRDAWGPAWPPRPPSR